MSGEQDTAPEELLLYYQMIELRIPLVAGGIFDQPDPLYHIVMHAGNYHKQILKEHEEQTEFEDLAKQAFQRAQAALPG